MKQLMLGILFSLSSIYGAYANDEVSQEYLGEVLVESREGLYQDPPEQDYARLVAFGLDTRYSVFVRSWLYFELQMVTQKISLQPDDEAAKARQQILFNLRRQIDLE
ncbi:hypothetical protein F9L16_21610 [Agarivorans sp. B2Z047]|uniref:Uncharacterized protein n=1 Tax=Agarivorans albus MKT 106 TaxID=1331007 RepID=R9PM72_AGAAL|nr:MULTISPECIES: hypothetical protein [Agarivorans]MPW31577.1 hypothetical protein [Agarivorans sp. B2Z047]UQN42620.1 hypothetical protein LQZ07_23040 [Agarivorans sp. B2Z047]GAD02343.1 hypothetical protein AALB_2423 [Agarivorans albus MKT 106]